MGAADKELKGDRLYVRVSRRQRQVIGEAAEAADKDLSAFVLEAALEQARTVLADRRFFALDETAWRRFTALLDRPVTPLASKPRLEELLQTPSALER